MQFKKLVLAGILILIPAQSWAIGSAIQTAANNALDFISKYRAELTIAGLAGACAGTLGFLAYNDFKKQQAKKAFWDRKTDSEIVKLATVFMQGVEGRLSPQLEKLRTSSPSIKANLKTLDYVCNTITSCKTWLERLTKRSLFACAQKMKDLESELIYLKDNMDIFVNNDF